VKKSRGFILTVLLLGVMISMFATVAAKTPTTISFWFPGQTAVNEQYFLNAIKSFEKIHPEINVEVTILPSTVADINTKLNAALLSGTYPDVLSVFLSSIAARGAKGDFLPLNSLVNSWADKKDIYESALKMGMYRNKMLGMGFYPAPEILTYRKDYFKEAGLDPEKPPATWGELADYAKKLTKLNARGEVIRAGFDIPVLNAAPFFKTFMRQNGSIVINEKKELPAFTDKKSIDAWKFIFELKKANVSIPYDYEKRDNVPFVKGNSAMSYLQTAQILNMLQNDPTMKDKLGFAPILIQQKKVAFCGYRLFTIGSKTKHKKEAWELIKYMMSKEQMMLRYKQLNIPVVRTSLENEFIASNPALNKVQLEYVKYGKGAESVPWVNIAFSYVQTAYEEVYNNRKTPEQALKDAESNLQRDLKAMKAR
jgi:ABC-type glycerol-3-phosphate transport system substrate-binding protein